MASDPVISRLITRLAADEGPPLKAIRAARAAARERAWALAGPAAPGVDGALIPLGIDATIVPAHSEKANARPVFSNIWAEPKGQAWSITYGLAAGVPRQQLDWPD